MSEYSIRVRGLSKRYRLGTAAPYHRFSELLIHLASAPARVFRAWERSLRHEGVPAQDHLWALDDVSFDVQPGEVLGVIGRNGAGKSTLLKILSRITFPTAGEVRIRGRVGSLLEIGTGFHPELTGRENIFLYGSILGMTRAEIRDKFTAIVEFSEVEQFVDTPVKRYSSGMYMRLAFAIAAHVHPDVLLLDEVLAVGDVAFQKKCFGKMNEVATAGRTVLFVSHNMAAVQQMAPRSIVLNAGRLAYHGPTTEAVARYLELSAPSDQGIWENPQVPPADEEVALLAMRIRDSSGQTKSHFHTAEPVVVEMEVEVREPHELLKVGFDLFRSGVLVIRSMQVDDARARVRLAKGKHILYAVIPTRFLNLGGYEIAPHLSLHCLRGMTIPANPVLKFTVDLDTSASPFHGTINAQNHPAAVFPMLAWSVDGDPPQQ